ncbi:hypothetical protein ACQW02_27605 [Humitalea sp. 24SJ18S-53]|uniref:hypothetical protein n=1 Tax=Humitalea sp. 24SJ18S-53 TaxID=3422307 RepID=UPI003D6731E6
MIRYVLSALLLAAPAVAQTPAGVPEPLRGAWFGPDCTAPESMLFVTPRAAVTLPMEGAARMLRFVEIRDRAPWTIGTGRGAEAPRLALRAEGEGLVTAAPSAKTRDDRLPGEAATETWRRCPGQPAAFAAMHGEGLAFLGALERLEAACTGPADACIAALVAVGDVSGDGALGTAEIARLLRGAAWVMAAQEGGDGETLAAANAAGAISGLLAAHALVGSLDYDGDGKLSVAELRQDRGALPMVVGDAAGRPFRTETVTDGAGFLRSLIEGMMGSR